MPNPRDWSKTVDLGDEAPVNRGAISTLRESINSLASTIGKTASVPVKYTHEFGRGIQNELGLHEHKLARTAASMLNPMAGKATEKFLETQAYKDLKGIPISLIEKGKEILAKRKEKESERHQTKQDEFMSSVIDMGESTSEIIKEQKRNKNSKTGQAKSNIANSQKNYDDLIGLQKENLERDKKKRLIEAPRRKKVDPRISPKPKVESTAGGDEFGGGKHVKFSFLAFQAKKPREIRSKLRSKDDYQVAQLSTLMRIYQSLDEGDGKGGKSSQKDSSVRGRQMSDMGGIGRGARAFFGSSGEQMYGISNWQERTWRELRLLRQQLVGEKEIPLGTRIGEAMSAGLSGSPVMRNIVSITKMTSSVFKKAKEKKNKFTKWTNELSNTSSPMNDTATNTAAIYGVLREGFSWIENYFSGTKAPSGDTASSRKRQTVKGMESEFIPSGIRDFVNMYRQGTAWYKGKPKGTTDLLGDTQKFAGGGKVKDKGAPKDKDGEMLIKAKAGEWVFTPEQLTKLFKTAMESSSEAATSAALKASKKVKNSWLGGAASYYKNVAEEKAGSASIGIGSMQPKGWMGKAGKWAGESVGKTQKWARDKYGKTKSTVTGSWLGEGASYYKAAAKDKATNMKNTVSGVTGNLKGKAEKEYKDVKGKLDDWQKGKLTAGEAFKAIAKKLLLDIPIQGSKALAKILLWKLPKFLIKGVATGIRDMSKLAMYDIPKWLLKNGLAGIMTTGALKTINALWKVPLRVIEFGAIDLPKFMIKKISSVFTIGSKLSQKAILSIPKIAKGVIGGVTAVMGGINSILKAPQKLQKMIAGVKDGESFWGKVGKQMKNSFKKWNEGNLEWMPKKGWSILRKIEGIYKEQTPGEILMVKSRLDLNALAKTYGIQKPERIKDQAGLVKAIRKRQSKYSWGIAPALRTLYNDITHFGEKWDQSLGMTPRKVLLKNNRLQLLTLASSVGVKNASKLKTPELIRAIRHRQANDPLYKLAATFKQTGKTIIDSGVATYKIFAGDNITPSTVLRRSNKSNLKILALEVGVKNPDQFKTNNDLIIAIRLQQRINTTIWGKAYTGLKSIGSTMLNSYKWAFGDWTPRKMLARMQHGDLVKLARDNYGIKNADGMTQWQLMKEIQSKQRWESNIIGRTWKGLSTIGKGISSIWKFAAGTVTPASILQQKDRKDLELIAKRYGINPKKYKTNHSLMKAIQKAERGETSILGKAKSFGQGIKSSYKSAKGMGGFLKEGLKKGAGSLKAGAEWASRRRFDMDDWGSAAIPEQKRGFATGGIVAGAFGKATKVVAHGGERILTSAQQKVMGGKGTNSIEYKTYSKLSELVSIQKNERHDEVIHRRREKKAMKEERWFRKWKKARAAGKWIMGMLTTVGGFIITGLSALLAPVIGLVTTIAGGIMGSIIGGGTLASVATTLAGVIGPALAVLAAGALGALIGTLVNKGITAALGGKSLGEWVYDNTHKPAIDPKDAKAVDNLTTLTTKARNKKKDLKKAKGEDPLLEKKLKKEIEWIEIEIKKAKLQTKVGRVQESRVRAGISMVDGQWRDKHGRKLSESQRAVEENKERRKMLKEGVTQTFALGGLVRGKPGKPVRVKAHAGEMILSPEQTLELAQLIGEGGSLTPHSRGVSLLNDTKMRVAEKGMLDTRMTKEGLEKLGRITEESGDKIVNTSANGASFVAQTVNNTSVANTSNRSSSSSSNVSGGGGRGNEYNALENGDTIAGITSGRMT